jgi:hypothetical protein
MHHLLFVLFPCALAATRSLMAGIQLPGRSAERPIISAEMEFQFLLVVIFCLSGLVISLNLIFLFPDVGAITTEYNQF